MTCKEQYNEQGFVVFKSLVSEADLNALRTQAEDAIRGRVEPIRYDDESGPSIEAVPSIYKSEGGKRVFRRLESFPGSSTVILSAIWR